MVSKYCTPPGRDKGEMTEEGGLLPARPASDSWKSASIAPEDRKESDGSLVMMGGQTGAQTQDTLFG